MVLEFYNDWLMLNYQPIMYLQLLVFYKEVKCLNNLPNKLFLQGIRVGADIQGQDVGFVDLLADVLDDSL